MTRFLRYFCQRLEYSPHPERSEFNSRPPAKGRSAHLERAGNHHGDCIVGTWLGLRGRVPAFCTTEGFTLYFWTADGIPIRDNVAGRIEADPASMNPRLAPNVVSRGGLVKDYWLLDSTNPPLTINPTPPPHTQLIAGAGDVWRLSEIMASYEAKGWGDINNPTPVHWCACRSNLPAPAWQQSLRPFNPDPKNLPGANA